MKLALAQRLLATTLVTLAVGIPAASGDTVYISSGGRPLPYAKVKVTKIVGDQIFFTSAEGRETSKPLETVARLAIDDEPVFTAAEEAYSLEKWDAAVDGYQRTLRSTSKPWL